MRKNLGILFHELSLAQKHDSFGGGLENYIFNDRDIGLFLL